MHCQASDTASAKRHGITDAEIQAVWSRDDDVFDAGEKAVLTLADELSLARPDGTVTPDLQNRLLAAYSQGQVMELCVVAAILTGMAKMLFALNLVERDVVCFLPPSQDT